MADTLVWQPVPGTYTNVAAVNLHTSGWVSLDAGVATQQLNFSTAAEEIMQAYHGYWQPRALSMEVILDDTTSVGLLQAVNRLNQLANLPESQLLWTPTSGAEIQFEVIDADVISPVDSQYNLNSITVTINMVVRPFAHLPTASGVLNLIDHGNFWRPDIVYGDNSTHPQYNFINIGTWQQSYTQSSSTQNIVSYTPTGNASYAFTATTQAFLQQFKALISADASSFSLMLWKAAGATGTLSIRIVGLRPNYSEALYYETTVDISTLGTTSYGVVSVGAPSGFRSVQGYFYSIIVKPTSITGTAYVGGTSTMGYTDGESYTLGATANQWVFSSSLELYMVMAGLQYSLVDAYVEDLVSPSVSTVPYRGSRYALRYGDAAYGTSETVWWGQLSKTVTANATYYTSVDYWAQTTNGCGLRILIDWRTGGGSLISTTTITKAAATNNDSTWHTLSGSATAPATAATADWKVEAFNGTGSNKVLSIYAARCFFAQCSALPPFFIESTAAMPALLQTYAPSGATDSNVYWRAEKKRGGATSNQVSGLYIAQSRITKHTENLLPCYPFAAARYWVPNITQTTWFRPKTSAGSMWHLDAPIDHKVGEPGTSEKILAQFNFGDRADDSYAFPQVYGTFRVLVRTQIIPYTASTDWLRLRARLGLRSANDSGNDISYTKTIATGPWVPVNWDRTTQASITLNWMLNDLGTLTITPDTTMFDSITDAPYYIFIDTEAPSTYNGYWKIIADCMILLPTEDSLWIQDPNDNLLPDASSTYFWIDGRKGLKGAAETNPQSSWSSVMHGAPPKIGLIPRHMLVTQNWQASDAVNDDIVTATMQYHPTLTGIGQ